MNTQLSLFGTTQDESQFYSETWGQTTFKKSKELEKKCLKCLLYRNQEECGEAKCYPHERQDRQNGYFTINQMPFQHDL